MPKTFLAAWLIIAWLFPARPIAQSGTVAYVLLDRVDSSYLWSNGDLKPRFPYWNGYGTSMGAQMVLESMVREPRGLRFCLRAGHSYGDYGWTARCTTGWHRGATTGIAPDP